MAYGKTAVPRIESEIGTAYRDPSYEIPTSATGDGIETLCAILESSEDLQFLAPLKTKAEALGAVLSVGLSGAVWTGAVDDRVLNNAQRVEFRDLNSENLSGANFKKWCASLREAGVGITLRLESEASLGALDIARKNSDALALVVPLASIREHGLDRGRSMIAQLKNAEEPLIFAWEMTEVDPVLAPSTVLGGLLCDGLGDGIRMPIRSEYDGIDPVNVAYTLLQATRYRTVRTEYVSCPSCGRTLFDLEETTKKIKELTGHLPNVTIAIMGCIVNGPGEMADADFGYVGWKPGKVDLWVGKEVVEKAIPEEEAPLRLVDLLKKHGVWMEPAELVES
ncbi:MAG: flavodoxin-dependent (E)-4-hydroxy-3-methylbut-2-enyl-diphosphate synthase [Planctomycetota bacterium]|nr:flavodoxin-dependent (E)-4-hydroxy-3-methylbut-2-enyl-diphosphate synthase [Planctomycetota bacterium]